MKKLMKFLFLIYLFFVLKLTFGGIGSYSREDGEYSEIPHNFMPFKTITYYVKNIEHYNLDTWIYNIFGNMMMFMPFGFFLSMLFVKKFSQIFYISVIASSTIEIFQYLTRAGAFDVDDIILNTTGSIIGFLIFKIIQRFWKGDINDL